MQADTSTSYFSSLRSALNNTLLALSVTIAGCSSVPMSSKPASTTTAKSVPAPVNPDAAISASRQPSLPAAKSGRGGYYQDDGPGDNAPANLLAVPDAEPKIEPVFPSTTRPYVVFGKTYTPLAANEPLKQRGIGSWYGKKFHGQKTASGERYDMYKMTAAHPTMPLPSYARVTNLSNGNQVIVRVNDRGPFHSSRIIDLSFTAAMKLGYVGKGSSELEVERLMPAEIARLEKSRLGERAVALAELPRNSRAPIGTLTTVAQRPSSGVVSQVDTVVPIPLSTSAPLIDQVATLPDPMSSFDSVTASAVRATPAAIAPEMTANMSGPGAYYLQLGAFSQALNAETARDQLARDTTQSLPPLEIAQAGTVFKVFSGPFQSRSDAAIAAQRLGDTGGLKAFVVQR